MHHSPFAIRKVLLPGGEVDGSHPWGAHDVYRALQPGAAWTVTKILEANVRKGTGVAAQIPGREVAGKTGTTTDWTDAWFAGYTPRLTTVTWVGYPLRTRSMADVHGIQVQGGTFPAQIWHTYMVETLGHVRPAHFLRPAWPVQPYVGPRSMKHPPKHTRHPTKNGR
jgi:penicillin-binding protein 1A